MRLAVAGGTGVVGKFVVEAAAEAGHEVVSLSRRTGVDVRTGEGLAEALRGVEVIVDTTNAGTTNRDKATAFFTEVTRNLGVVGAGEGVARLVILSIVGLERVPGYGYYEAKLAHEKAAMSGLLPATIVRATQFHEFPAQVLSWTRHGPFAVVPRSRIQPVAARRSAGSCSMWPWRLRAGSGLAPGPGPAIGSRWPVPRKPTWCRWRALSSATEASDSGSFLSACRDRPARPCAREASCRRPTCALVGPTFSEWIGGPDLALV